MSTAVRQLREQVGRVPPVGDLAGHELVSRLRFALGLERPGTNNGIRPSAQAIAHVVAALAACGLARRDGDGRHVAS